MSFSDKLKTLRTENKMTQKEVALRLNVARSTIAGYEKKNRQPSHENLAALADLFHVIVDYLVKDNVISMDNSQCVSLSEKEMQLITSYRKLPSASRELVTAHIHLLEEFDINHKNPQ